MKDTEFTDLHRKKQITMKIYKTILFIILALIVFTSMQSFAQKDTSIVILNKIIEDEVDIMFEEFVEEELELKENARGDYKIFIHVKQMPKFPGGKIALKRWLGYNFNYPVVARENGIQGTVYLRFEVKKDGRIGKIELQKGVDPLLDEEVIKVIKKLPRFKPGEQNGRKVNVWYSIPFTPYHH